MSALFVKGLARKNDKRPATLDLFVDDDRGTGFIRPMGRIRLRRFIDIETGSDFAVTSTLQNEQKYGLFTEEIYTVALTYVREHQDIFHNPPNPKYATDNIF